jgi:hypothetical protein
MKRLDGTVPGTGTPARRRHESPTATTELATDRGRFSLGSDADFGRRVEPVAVGEDSFPDVVHGIGPAESVTYMQCAP